MALKAAQDSLTARIKAMDDAGISEQPDTDPQVRVMRRGRISYNAQSTVDSKHRLISDVDEVQAASDLKQRYRNARRTQVQLKSDTLEVLADAGYSNGSLFRQCKATWYQALRSGAARDE
ncbi:MAG: hypothetical protein WDZ50_06860 [Woeseia sp.]